MIAYTELLAAHHRQEMSKKDVLERIHDEKFTCMDARTTTAINRLSQFYRAELQMNKYNVGKLIPQSHIFQQLVDDMFLNQKLTPVLPITVLCREPNGELGELLLHEVAPKTLNTTVDGEWDRAVAKFIWEIIAKQSYEMFFLSHSPQLRIPPSVKSVLTMTPAQIEAKQRATRFLLHSAFVNRPENMAALHKKIGMSPWKYLTCNLQTFGFQQGTIGFVRVKIDPTKQPTVTRGILAMCDIKMLSLARAALFFDPYHEFLLILESSKSTKKNPLVSVFVVAKALLSINENGDVYQNVVPKLQD